MDLIVNTALPEDLESMGGSFNIYDALQLRWSVIGVEDARKASIRGIEHAPMEAAKQGSYARIDDGNVSTRLQHYTKLKKRTTYYCLAISLRPSRWMQIYLKALDFGDEVRI